MPSFQNGAKHFLEIVLEFLSHYDFTTYFLKFQCSKGGYFKAFYDIYGLNVSTTPLWQWVFWQCLPFSWPTLRDKHCRHPIAVIEVVDTFGHSYWATSDKYPSNHFQQLSEEGLSMLVTWICISDGLYDHSANRHMPFLGSKVKRVFQENLLDFHPQHIQG